MGTSYDDVINSFLLKISDDFLSSLSDIDFEKILDKYMISACSEFKKCTKLKNRNDVLRQFNSELTNEESEILADLMVLEWLKPKMNSDELLEQRMTTKDYKMYSQGNHLDKLISLKKETKNDIHRRIVSYVYSSNSLDGLEKKVYDYD